jgi:hypothetical protein
MRKVSRIQGTIFLHILLREASQHTLNCILISIIVIECRLLAKLWPQGRLVGMCMASSYGWKQIEQVNKPSFASVICSTLLRNVILGG